jgi:hypothetical protein
MKKLFFLFLLAGTPVLATSTKDAYVRESIQSGKSMWEIGNARIQAQLSYIGRQLLLTKLSNPGTGADWTPPRDQASLSQLIHLRFRNREYRFQVPDEEGSFRLKAHRITSDDKSVRLELVFSRAGSLPLIEVYLYYRVFPGSFVETWTEVRNLNPTAEPRLELLSVGQSHLPVGANDGHWEVADTNATRYGEPLRIDWLDLHNGQSRQLPLHGSSPALPDKGFVQTFWLRRSPSDSLIGGIYYGHRSPLGFGVPGTIRFARSQDGTAIQAELQDASEELGEKREILLLGSNQYVRSLTFIFTFSKGDLSSVTSAYHHLLRHFLQPPAPTGSEPSFPWVEYNAYFAYDLGFSARKLKRDADMAAELGAEVFIVDAGWWESALKKCEIVTDFSDYLVHVGNYTPDHTSRFPAAEVSYKDFSNYVHAKGMKFGLWVCPFNVDLTHNTGWDQSWLAEDGKHLCAAHKPAFEWVLNQISRLVREYQVDFLKFDCESAPRCVNPDHETKRQVGARTYVITAHQGYNDLIRALRERHPAVAMEAGPLLGHVEASTDDWELSPEGGRAEMQKARFVKIPQYTAQYLMREPSRKRGMSEEHYLSYMDYVVRSNILGHIILSSELSSWRPRFRSIVKRHIQIYRGFRQVLTGDTYELAFDRDWEGLQFHDPQSDNAVVFAFKKTEGNPQHRFVLCGLQAETTYRVSSEDRKEALNVTGKQLMSGGISLDLPLAETSDIIYIQPDTRSPHASRSGKLASRTLQKEGGPTFDPMTFRQGEAVEGKQLAASASDSLKTYFAPYLKGADETGHVVVFRDGSDFDPETYDLGFDGNVGTLHVPLARLSEICPRCVTKQNYCESRIWNCQECPRSKTNPGHPDSDHDSLPDWWEEFYERDMDPLEDSDGDGLNNYAEYWHMTNPLSKDTDSDGWPDALEIGSFETDPLRPEPEIQMLFVDPASGCRSDCGTRERPSSSLQAMLGSRRMAAKTLVLVATGILNESVELAGQLPHGSFVGLFGGFDPRTWTRGNGQTILQGMNDKPALRLSSPLSKSSRLVVEGFTLVGGVLIDGTGDSPMRVKLSRNRIVNSPRGAGVEILRNPNGQVQLINNYIAGNKAGVLSTPTWLLVLNCTIVDNGGPGIYVSDEGSGRETAWSTSINNILWNNAVDLSGVTSVVATICRNDPRCSSTDPELVKGSPEISSTSPARDAGIYPVGEIELFFDLEGHPRVVGKGIDLGAVEIRK